MPMRQKNLVRLTAVCAQAVLSLLVGCSGDESNATAPETASAGQSATTAGSMGGAPSAGGNSGSAPTPSGAGAGALGSAGTPAVVGNGASGGSATAGMSGAPAMSTAGSSGSVAAAGGGAAGDAANTPITIEPPRDYGARGPYEVVVEKNVGEKFRNTGLTDDAARCASLVSGLGADADGGDWAIYPTDMDRQLYTLFRPAEFKEGEKYPVITWGNGTCSQPLLFEPLLGHLASHGFVIIATNWRWVAGGVEMKRALDYVLAENDNPEFAGKQRHGDGWRRQTNRHHGSHSRRQCSGCARARGTHVLDRRRERHDRERIQRRDGV